MDRQIVVDFLFLEDKVLFGPVGIGESADDFDLVPRVGDDFVNGLNGLFLILVYTAIEVAYETVVFIAVELGEQDPVVADSDNFEQGASGVFIDQKHD